MGVSHEVTNQVPPLVGHDPIAGDAALAEACVRHADVATLDSLEALGALAGSEQAQDSLLLRHAPTEVAETFCATRLAGDWGAVPGTLPGGTPVRVIMERARVPAP